MSRLGVRTQLTVTVLLCSIVGVTVAWIFARGPDASITSEVTNSARYPEGTVIQSVSSALYPAPEEGEIELAQVVARGTVGEISTSCWNASSCEFRAPEEVWSELEDEILYEFQPMKYYSVTFNVSEFWYNGLELTTPLTITLIGRSPVDPAPTALPTGEPGYIVEDDFVQEDWIVDAEMILLLRESELKIDDMSVPTLYATYGSQYYVLDGGGLGNSMADDMPRSTTIDELHAKVDAIKN